MKQYFVTNYYHPANRTIMEDELMRRAKVMYLHCLVVNPEQMVDTMKKQQALLKDANKRLKEVQICLSSDKFGRDGLRWFYIGASHLVLQEVRTDGGVEATV